MRLMLLALFCLCSSALAAPKILILTDEPGGRAAEIARWAFETTEPFPCLGTEVQILRMSREELDCRPYNDGRPRILLCSNKANQLAQRLRRQYGARRVLIVVDHPVFGGSGGRTPVVSTAGQYVAPKIGLHEVMHTLGFRDTYGNEEYAPVEGDVMRCSGEACYIPYEWFPQVARGMGVRRLPQECR